ncbi:uncharacterized protein PgNI_12351, partial [Pyricularia grisea]|uniref:Uncharacterized protein n=1 Tax=Pyricularia grisea TaxID=148305 RepID=A0A6P8AMU3_PYRGI
VTKQARWQGPTAFPSSLTGERAISRLGAKAQPHWRAWGGKLRVQRKRRGSGIFQFALPQPPAPASTQRIGNIHPPSRAPAHGVNHPHSPRPWPKSAPIFLLLSMNCYFNMPIHVELKVASSLQLRNRRDAQHAPQKPLHR